MAEQTHLERFAQQNVKPSQVEAVRKGDYKDIGEVIAEASTPSISSIEEGEERRGAPQIHSRA